MLYYLLRPIFRLSIFAYFRKVDVIGKENIPKKGPVIFVANHPSALMDPLVAAVFVRRKVHFLAGAEWFGTGLKASLFKKQFNMIPVYRPWKQKTKGNNNVDMFKDCYKVLENNGCIILFPEASSQTISKIRELKTGAIRIKKGAEAESVRGIDIPIIPIGLNYSNPHQFQSKLLVNIGQPVDFKSVNPDPIELVKEQTIEIESALKETIININDDENESLISQVNRVFIGTIREDVLGQQKDVAADFRFGQDIAKAVEIFKRTDEANFKSISKRLNAYFRRLTEIGFLDETIDSKKGQHYSPWHILILFIGAPLGIIASFIFTIPFIITRSVFLSRLKPKIADTYDDEDHLNPSFTGSLIFTAGMVVFMTWTLLLSLTLGFIFHSWLVIVFAFLIGYPLFQFSLYYSCIFSKIKIVYNQRKLIKHHRTDLLPLQRERRKLIEIFKSYRREYDAMYN